MKIRPGDNPQSVRCRRVPAVRWGTRREKIRAGSAVAPPTLRPAPPGSRSLVRHRRGRGPRGGGRRKVRAPRLLKTPRAPAAQSSQRGALAGLAGSDAPLPPPPEPAASSPPPAPREAARTSAASPRGSGTQFPRRDASASNR